MTMDGCNLTNNTEGRPNLNDIADDGHNLACMIGDGPNFTDMADDITEGRPNMTGHNLACKTGIGQRLGIDQTQLHYSG